MYETWKDLPGPDRLGSRTFLFFVDDKLAGWNSNGDARMVLANLGQPTTAKKHQSSEKSKPTSKVSTGTGFFVNGNGYLVTNNHVIETCDSIYVKEYGKELSVKNRCLIQQR
ncbi:MAG TPA: S1C family serine protease [Rhodospirillales bacterium]|jgi:S1-C subfamily serine protease|nr:S1C family serine protease [Rhodospirillales bacterium]|tara:strand:- start:13 stop:348 length:336 start_codon:yes stop_codon:yes gene_type:complete